MFLTSSLHFQLQHRFLTSTTKLFASVVSTANYVQSDKFNLSVLGTTSTDFNGDILIVPFYKPKIIKSDEVKLIASLKELIPSHLSKEAASIVAEVIDDGHFKADLQSRVSVRLGSMGFKYLAVAGLGSETKVHSAPDDLDAATALKYGKTVGAALKDIKAKTAGVLLPPHMGSSGLTQFLIGFYDSVYLDQRFRSEGKNSPYNSATITLLGCSEAVARDAELTHRLTRMVVDGVELAKDLVNAPPCSKTPLVIADQARQIAAETGLKCTVLGEAECRALGMGGYLGVQQGSKFPPQFVHLAYIPESASEPHTVLKVALVGKGLTFDSGGYNLKTGGGSMIELMKFDMGGCAAVLGCAKAIGQLKPKNVEVHWISAVCENMVSAEAMRPGDVLVASNGKTIEVANTDAEGRLTLADALVYAEKLGVDVIIDLATLTGACMVALGDKLAGLYSPDSGLRQDIERAAIRSQEGIWRLPLEAQYKDMIKSHIADLKNIGGKNGGSITAALFLQEFVEKAKWAHIDMAGPVWDSKENKPTGYGVKLLVDYLLNAKK